MESKKKEFLEKARKNKENFDLHRNLIEQHLCISNKEYFEDLKKFYERQVVSGSLLLRLIEYAEEYHRITDNKKEGEDYAENYMSKSDS